jgi:hypothetical protein
MRALTMGAPRAVAAVLVLGGCTSAPAAHQSHRRQGHRRGVAMVGRSTGYSRGGRRHTSWPPGSRVTWTDPQRERPANQAQGD